MERHLQQSADSYQLNFRAGTAAQIAEPDFDTTSGPFMRVTPALLVRQVRDRAQNAYYLGEVKADGGKYDVVGFSMAVGPAISLYFDKETHLITRSERVLPGFGLVEYRFKEYEQVDGVPFNQFFELYLNGDHNMDRKNLSTRVNVPVDKLTMVDEQLVSVPAIVPDGLERREVAEGVYHIGGNGTYAMFVEMDDYVIAVGGTAGIPDRIGKLREVVPEKPIKYGVMTHHHFDHVLGVTAYEDEGATIITAAAHETIVRDAANDPDKVKIKAIKERKVFEDETRRVEILDIGPTAHTDNILVAYLPEEGILFEADHFAMPQSGPVPPAVSSTRTFAASLQANDLAVERIVSAHSPRVATMDDLRAALAKEAVQVGQN